MVEIAFKVRNTALFRDCATLLAGDFSGGFDATVRKLDAKIQPLLRVAPDNVLSTVATVHRELWELTNEYPTIKTSVARLHFLNDADTPRLPRYYNAVYSDTYEDSLHYQEVVTDWGCPLMKNNLGFSWYSLDQFRDIYLLCAMLEDK